MIDIDDKDIAARLETADGRFILLTRTDLPERYQLPWWGVTFDTGGDGFGILLALDAANGIDAWTGLELLAVLAARASAELDRRLAPHAADLSEAMRRAITIERRRLGRAAGELSPVLAAGGIASPYPWTEARRGEHILPLCPDPESRGPGITPEQLILALAILYADSAKAIARDSDLPAIRDLLGEALKAEHGRLRIVRGD